MVEEAAGRLKPIHPTAGKKHSRNFACTEFCEIRLPECASLTVSVFSNRYIPPYTPSDPEVGDG